MLQAAGWLGRHGPRDRTLLLVAYRHGLRVSELVALRWDQVDLKSGLLHVARLKNGLASTHPIRGPELRALRELKRAYPSSPDARRVCKTIDREGRYALPENFSVMASH